MNVLQQLYDGKFAPCDKLVRKGSELEKIQTALDKSEIKLYKTLSKSQRKLFERYKNCDIESITLMELDAFKEGFRLGAKLMLAIFDDNDSNLEDSDVNNS